MTKTFMYYRISGKCNLLPLEGVTTLLLLKKLSVTVYAVAENAFEPNKTLTQNCFFRHIHIKLYLPENWINTEVFCPPSTPL